MLEVDIARYIALADDLEFKIFRLSQSNNDDRLAAELQVKATLFRSIAKRFRSLDKEIIRGVFMMVYECPRCKNEEHNPGANYCKICGLKIQRE